MRLTRHQASTNTIADLYKAIDRRIPVTITYLKEERRRLFKVDGEGDTTVVRSHATGRLIETVRTVEPYEIATTKTGDIVVKAIDREAGESRTWRIDRIAAYTLHRSTTYALPSPLDEEAEIGTDASPAITAALRVAHRRDGRVTAPAPVVADLIDRELARPDGAGGAGGHVLTTVGASVAANLPSADRTPTFTSPEELTAWEIAREDRAEDLRRDLERADALADAA
ncbi:WYL domain-containing protein [Streptomyces sp. ST2-7A]|uniref:WYL domain-containing protein n=1 Tax=Streptomyces sp. ST2-7A TaxID=2907214 RepID=UPI001F25636E|nr:WYL domain-containing protein [Streptomyces sp. ST2-7A]MCE7081199.1 WYL domain-containing protein [Streptomyces sp. ST2-7A]